MADLDEVVKAFKLGMKVRLEEVSGCSDYNKVPEYKKVQDNYSDSEKRAFNCGESVADWLDAFSW